MCGIFGAVSLDGKKLSKSTTDSVLKIAKMSERRGSDASGLLTEDHEKFSVIKCNAGIKSLLTIKEAKVSLVSKPNFLIAGHTRLSTHGYADNSKNNQPAISENWIIFHNGIILDHQKIIQDSGTLGKNDFELDSYALNAIMEKGYSARETQNILNKLSGEISFLALCKSGQIYAYSNVGNMYFSYSKGSVLIASESIFLKKTKLRNIEKIDLNQLVLIRDVSPTAKPIIEKEIESRTESVKLPTKRNAFDAENSILENTLKILNQQPKYQRCVKCLLPKNFPGITFSDNGLCSICKNWNTPIPRGLDSLLNLISEKEVILNLSGGRDSCYAQSQLHVLQIKTTAFTYDWGFISTAARENMALLCGKFSHEHVVVSPDLEANRKIVRAVLECWLQNPDVAVIPLLMAGDKPFHSLSIKIAKERGNSPIIQADHYLETTGFKSMLAGARVDFNQTQGGVNYRLDFTSIIKMGIKYTNFVRKIKNHRSKVFLQMVKSFFVYYQLKHSFIRIFDYIPWDEKIIDKELSNLGWKSNARSHSAKWRMGDSTAPMYNSLYLLNLGYTENDAMISNQIRAGLISRKEGLDKLTKLNEVDAAGIVEYLDLLGVDHQLYLDYLQSLIADNSK